MCIIICPQPRAMRCPHPGSLCVAEVADLQARPGRTDAEDREDSRSPDDPGEEDAEDPAWSDAGATFFAQVSTPVDLWSLLWQKEIAS